MPSRWSAPIPSESASLADPRRDLRGSLHEVANALTVVVGWLERAVDGTELPPEARRAVEIALARAHDGRIVARKAIGADTGASSIEEELTCVVEEAVSGALPQADARRVTLSVAVSGDVALVDDARQALQVVTNLLFNAIAFSPEGASVEIDARSDGDEVVVRVSDRGPGVPEQMKRVLFTGSASARPGGAGVGLAHSRALARTLGGELCLVPSAVGATFELRWPRAAERSGRTRALAATDALDGMRLLIVEDDAAVLVLLETALGGRGAEVACARDHAEIERATRGHGFDAALLDLSPLGDGGASIIASLRAANPQVRVVLISGNACPPDELLRHCDTWVRKPFDLAEVTAALTPPRESA